MTLLFIRNSQTYICACVFVSIILCAALSVSASEIRLDDSVDSLSLGRFVVFYEDESTKDSIQEILAHENRQWEISDAEQINFGFTDSSYWLKFTFRNSELKPLSRFVEIAYPILDHVDVFFVRENKVFRTLSMGDKYPFSKREIKHRNFIIPIDMGALDSFDLILNIRTTSSMQVPATLLTKSTVFEKNQTNMLGFGIYFGIMFVMILYNIFVYISVREISYFYYVLYVSSMVMFIGSLNGFGFQFLWPESIWWNDQAVAVGIAGITLFALMFMRIFLDLPGSKPRLNRFAGQVGFYCCMVFVGSFVLPYRVTILIVIFNAVALIFLALLVGIIRWVEGYTAARYYTVAWATMFVGGFILAINKLGLVSRNILTENAALYGSAIEVVFLSFALADRLNTEKKERFEAQLISIENERIAHLAQADALMHERLAREAQERALIIQKKANETLEQNVRSRTNELQNANKKLQELSMTDSLTGLKNRRYFNEIFHREYARAARDKTALTSVIMDIDNFKNFNDTYGHLIGDDCLKAVANTIKVQLNRENDFVARYGGEEFCVLLPNTTAEGALGVAEKIRSCVEQINFKVGDTLVVVTISIGVAVDVPGRHKNPEHLLILADKALYESKKKGRNRVTLFDAREPMWKAV